MLKRRGFTLIELLVSIVLLGIVGLAMARLMTAMLRVTTAQVQLAGSQGTSRTGSLAIPSEFREIGFDTIPNVGISSDLETIKANRLTFRAMRGMGNTCAITTTGGGAVDEFWIRKPILGLRNPQATDSFRLFVENENNRGDDDQWVAMVVRDVDLNATCGADPAIHIIPNATPTHLPAGAGGDVLGSHVVVGGPIRWFERMEYGPFIDGTTGRTFLGARSLNLTQNALIPMVGPLTDSTGFALTYYDADGVVLDPANAANRVKVRSIGVNLVGATTAATSLYGASNRSRGTSPVFTRVALRNNIRPAP
jgi:prepilin-type N-terminal cleavage/methylation domain-containing protein